VLALGGGGDGGRSRQGGVCARLSVLLPPTLLNSSAGGHLTSERNPIEDVCLEAQPGQVKHVPLNVIYSVARVGEKVRRAAQVELEQREGN
jgi:hypothetical protein